MLARIRGMTGGAPTAPLVILAGLNCVDELDRAAFNVLLPEIRDTFGLSLGGVLLLVAAIVPVTVLLGIPVAFYADRTKRLRLAAIGASVWSIFSIFTGLAVNLIQLGIARIGSGLGRTVNDPTHNSLLSDYYPVGVRPAVFSTYRSANSLGLLLGPLLAGFLTVWFSWRMPFLLFALPTLVLVALTFILREPKRGIQDRLALGVSEEEAAIEDTPPDFGEAWYSLTSIPSLRRIWLALPFLGGSAFGLQSILSLFYDEVYRQGAAERGLILAGHELFSIAGLLIGTPIATRALRNNPAWVLRILSITAIGSAAGLFILAVSPNLAVALGGEYLQALVGAIFLPGILAVFSVLLPAKTRSLGFVLGTLFFLPGFLLLPILGVIGDEYGLRPAILILIPVYLTGAFILASGGKFLADDIETTRLSSMAEQEVRRDLAAGEPKLLMIRNLDAGYSGVQVLFDVDLDLYPGETIALLGTNGAGKSTLLKAISGALQPAAGSVYFDGLDITHKDSVATTNLGLVQMPGGRAVFPTLSVREHLELAGWPLDDQTDVATSTREVLDIFPRLEERIDQPAGALSGGEQQMLGVGMALMARPKLLMIDELSLGLAPMIVEQLLDVIRRINDRGTSIILVEQSVNVALTIADRAYFMEKGAVRFSGPTAELLAREDILRSVFLKGAASRDGSDSDAVVGDVADEERPSVETRVPVGASERRGGALEVIDLEKSFAGITAVGGVSFRLGSGEILGIIGPNGAGKTTLFDLISGFVTPDGGQVLLDGQELTDWPIDKRARGGLGRSFQDARLFPTLTVVENLSVSLDRHLRFHSHIADGLRLPQIRAQERWVAERVDEVIEMMQIGDYRDKFAGELSTGSRRVVDLAMAILDEPTVLLLDEPSSGIAEREAEALGPLLLRLREEMGVSLLVIEHDIPLLSSISDRMLALDTGTVIAVGSPAEITANEVVIESYLGGDPATIARSGIQGPK